MLRPDTSAKRPVHEQQLTMRHIANAATAKSDPRAGIWRFYDIFWSMADFDLSVNYHASSARPPLMIARNHRVRVKLRKPILAFLCLEVKYAKASLAQLQSLSFTDRTITRRACLEFFHLVLLRQIKSFNSVLYHKILQICESDRWDGIPTIVTLVDCYSIFKQRCSRHGPWTDPELFRV